LDYDTDDDGLPDGVKVNGFEAGVDIVRLLDSGYYKNEIVTGIVYTDPLNPDTDGNGHIDGLDSYPLDPKND